jgi:dipeptidyl aminopeptidase/acylaminoacyl peptidase
MTAMRSEPSASSPAGARAALAALTIPVFAIAIAACRSASIARPSKPRNVTPFNFQLAVGKNQYQIEAYLALSDAPGRLPALLVLNAGEGNAQKCVEMSPTLTALGMQVACVSIPGYGRSSGPGRFVRPQAVAAASRALDLLAARRDVDPKRLGVWGLGDGAVAAGLLMDIDPRPRVVVLQSGAYDMLSLWPEARWTTKLSILRQVWPSRRVLKERSVIAHLPPRLGCSVLILHGERDRRMPVDQAERLAQALKSRAPRVEAFYFPKAPHQLGKGAQDRVADFLRGTLLTDGSQAKS